jgi:hypothetical protein
MESMHLYTLLQRRFVGALYFFLEAGQNVTRSYK